MKTDLRKLETRGFGQHLTGTEEDKLAGFCEHGNKYSVSNITRNILTSWGITGFLRTFLLHVVSELHLWSLSVSSSKSQYYTGIFLKRWSYILHQNYCPQFTFHSGDAVVTHILYQNYCIPLTFYMRTTVYHSHFISELLYTIYIS